jgi:hypothetical protein
LSQDANGKEGVARYFPLFKAVSETTFFLLFAMMKDPGVHTLEGYSQKSEHV